MEPKVLKIAPNVDQPERCLVSLYKKYVEHRPTHEVGEPLHLACIVNPKSKVWYKRQRLGIHSIEEVVKKLMHDGLGKEGFYSNSSLRRSAKTRMVEGGIPRELSKNGSVIFQVLTRCTYKKNHSVRR